MARRMPFLSQIFMTAHVPDCAGVPRSCGLWVELKRLQSLFHNERSLDLSGNLAPQKLLYDRQGEFETRSGPTAGDVMAVLLHSSLGIFIVI